MVSYREMISTTCKGCGVLFMQPDDPGKKRQFHSAACKQRDYRRRHPGQNHSGTHAETPGARRRREEREAWAKEEARREQERQRSERRRWERDNARQREEWARFFREAQAQRDAKVPGWVYDRDVDGRQAKRRRTCRLLWERASHPSTPEHEAQACRERAEEIRRRYGL